jgi:hypothetical protein
MIAPMLAVHFSATDTHRMQEIAYALIFIAGVLLALGSGLLLAGRGGRSLAGIALAIAGLLLFAAVRWGS